MTRKNSLIQAKDALLSAQRVLILSHQNPDGDAIGSSLALASGLAALEKTCDIVNTDGVPMNLTWLPLAERVLLQPDSATPYDVAVYLDCGSPGRIGFPPLCGARSPLSIRGKKTNKPSAAVVAVVAVVAASLSIPGSPR